MVSYRVTKNDRNFVETTALHIEIFYTNGGPHSLSAQKSLNILIKHAEPYIYTNVVQEVYNRDRSPEVDDVEGLAAAATKHLELLKG